jgi:hypothetical protein
MLFDVWIIHNDGTCETVANGVDEDRADKLRAEPNYRSCRVVVLPAFCDAPTAVVVG